MNTIDDLIRELQIFERSREKFIKYGKEVFIDNPDKLGFDELTILTETIFEYLDQFDMSLGFEHYDSGIKTNASEKEKGYLFQEFIDWYEIFDTPSNRILKYVKNNYPVDEYQNVLCVGDGRNCHLGRKLADLGYEVISIDPISSNVFDGRIGKGYLKTLQEPFSKDKKKLINWADIVVGSKVPMIADELVGLEKPTMFNISDNAEIHHSTYRGVNITSSKVLDRELAKTPGVQRKVSKDEFGEDSVIYLCDGRRKNERTDRVYGE
jgi:hypothetical protein